jgi:hypothetical protein
MSPTAADVARLFGCTADRVRHQYRRNAAQLRGMAEQAKRTGRLVNGYTAEQLQAKAAEYKNRGASL